MSQRPPSVSIRTLYAILVVLAILLSSALVGLIIQRQSAKAAVAAQKVLFAHIAHSVSDHVRSHFDNGLRLLDELAHRAATGALDVEDSEALAAYFAERLRFQQHLAWISYSDDRSGCFAGAWIDRADPVVNTSCPGEQGGVPQEFAIAADGTRTGVVRPVRPYDPRGLGWYRKAAGSADTVWTDITIFHEGRPGVTAARALRDPDGRLRGVFTVDFFTETISDFLAASQPGSDGLVFLFNGGDHLMPSGAGADDLTRIGWALAQADVLAGASETRLMELGGVPYFANSLPLPGVMGGTWWCAVLTPRSELLAVIEPHQRFAAIGVVAVCLAVVVIGWLISQWISAPLRRVSRQLQSVAEGTFDPPDAGSLSMIREVRYIQLAVSHMQQCLRERQEIERARLRAEQLSRDKDDFAAMISHELRTPIQVILGYSELLQAEQRDVSQETRDFSNYIYNSSLQLLELLNNLLNLFKLESGHYEVKTEPVVLDPLAHACIDSLMLKAKTKGIGLVFTTSAPSLQVPADPVMLRQIVANLLTNAIKFTDEGSVTVSVDREEDRAVIRVRDTGIGMSADEVQRIFTQYQQANQTIARKYGGTGLGLSICIRFAAMLGGDITCQSEAKKGTCFTLKLPLVATKEGEVCASNA